MSQTETIAAAAAPLKPGPATYHELKAALVGADAPFLTSQLDANATVAQATSAWMAEQNKRLETATATAKQASAGKGPGVRPLSTRPLEADQEAEEGGDVVSQFNAAVEKIAGPNAGWEKRQAAVISIANRNPALHQAYVLATNSGRAVRRTLEDKFEKVA